MRTWRRCAAWTFSDKLDGLGVNATGMLAGNPCKHPVAGNRKGDEDRLAIDSAITVATRPDGLDRQLDLPSAAFARPPSHAHCLILKV